MNNPCSATLFKWFQTSLGRRVFSEETMAMQQILPHLFGYHLLQIGNLGYGSLLESSLIRHRCVLSQFAYTMSPPYSSVYADSDALPFAHDSIDVVLLPHILEFEDNPHDILREVERILIPEGSVVILGFNPLGIWRSFFVRKGPSCGHFLSLLRLKDWLALLGFDVEQQSTFCFSLPFHNQRFKSYTLLLEKIGERWSNHFGIVYLLVAKKRRTTITPIGSSWNTHLTGALVTENAQFNQEKKICVKSS